MNDDEYECDIKIDIWQVVYVGQFLYKYGINWVANYHKCIYAYLCHELG